MPSPLPRLPVPYDVYSGCFRAVEQALRDWPVLQRVRPTFRVADGTPSETADEVDSQSPWVRIEPGGDVEGWATVGQHSSPLLIKISVFTAGTRMEDCTGLWSAIAGGGIDTSTTPPTPLPSALFPGDRSLWTTLNGLGARSYSVTQPAIGPSSDGVGILAVGMVRIELYISTNP